MVAVGIGAEDEIMLLASHWKVGRNPVVSVLLSCLSAVCELSSLNYNCYIKNVRFGIFSQYLVLAATTQRPIC